MYPAILVVNYLVDELQQRIERSDRDAVKRLTVKLMEQYLPLALGPSQLDLVYLRNTLCTMIDETLAKIKKLQASAGDETLRQVLHSIAEALRTARMYCRDCREGG